MRTVRQAQSLQHKHGFALLLALSLMAYAVLLMLSLSALVRVQTSLSARLLEQVLSKEKCASGTHDRDRRTAAACRPRPARKRARRYCDATGANPFWTGIWDSAQPEAAPHWLVSGKRSDQAVDPDKPVGDAVLMAPAHDLDGDGAFTAPGEFAATQAGIVSIDAQSSYAWWVADEGIKAAITPIKGIKSATGHAAYLDYTAETAFVRTALHDPVFDLAALPTASDPESARIDHLNRAVSRHQIAQLGHGLQDRDAIEAALVHSHCLRNRFVLSNPLDGGLKKDLSYLKTMDAASITQAELDKLYQDPENLITPDLTQLVQFRGRPTAIPASDAIGMRLPEATVAEIAAKTNDFTIAPVIVDFKFSAAVAADALGKHQSKSAREEVSNSPVYLVYKLYLKLWNPYTIPMRLGGDPSQW